MHAANVGEPSKLVKHVKKADDWSVHIRHVSNLPPNNILLTVFRKFIQRPHFSRNGDVINFNSFDEQISIEDAFY